VGIDLQRDRCERRLLSRALHCGLGVDGICRGAQLLNVALGGTLHQDLLLDGATRVAHRPGRGVATLRHAVSLERSSATAGVVGRSTLRELSQHHQAAGRVAPGLRVVGRSPDGIVEVLESPGGQARGYQFHPEAPGSQAGRAIFRDLVRRAREHAASRR
jgi:putative glutamine amidotransferase